MNFQLINQLKWFSIKRTNTHNEGESEVRIEGDEKYEYGSYEVIDSRGAGVRGARYRDDHQHRRQGPTDIL